MRRTSEAIIFLVLLSLIIAGVVISFHNRGIPYPDDSRHIRAMVELDGMADTSKALIVGYNCHILKRFAEANAKTADIRLVPKNKTYLDSLKAGAIDILVVPYNDSLKSGYDSVLISAPLDSMCVWFTGRDNGRWMKEINYWIKEWHDSEDCMQARDMFLVHYSPFDSDGSGRLSPYDEIMKEKADSCGLDWRLLCAIAYKESRFHIEKSSPRGASGLMQIMPHTGRYMGATNLVDPEQSISTASRYLKRLSLQYRRADDLKERTKLILAAYNAGEGRIQDCINYARFRNLDPYSWDNIVSLIPEMNDSTMVTESGVVKLGVFKGVETIEYVGKVMDIYERFCRICPEK